MFAVLLLVFWYCHKRGREVRLEKERLLTEAEIEALNEPSSSTLPQTTTGAEGAPSSDVEVRMHSQDGEPSSSGYAPGGSLARELAKEKETKSSQEAHTAPVTQGT